MWWGLGVFVLTAVGFAPAAGDTTALWIGGALGVVTWLVDVQLHPVTSCLWCRGDPKVRDAGGRNWRGCWWCSGTGRRRRVLARRPRDRGK